MHALDPTTAEEPVGQAAQRLEPATENVSRAQVMQIVEPVVEEKEPALQLRQDVCPLTLVMEPAAQAIQFWGPELEKKPGIQLQF